MQHSVGNVTHEVSKASKTLLSGLLSLQTSIKQVAGTALEGTAQAATSGDIDGKRKENDSHMRSLETTARL